MGDISIIARRLTPEYVQYGWSGNGGYYSAVGALLLEEYNTPERVEYLFSLGQLSHLFLPHSEKTTHWLRTSPTGRPHWVDNTERKIFSRIAFIDYGYFYDSDGKWYYVAPGPFRIKMPLELVGNHLDENSYEFDFVGNDIETLVINKVCEIYKNDKALQDRLNADGIDSAQVKAAIADCLAQERHPVYRLFDKHSRIFKQFDDWVLIKTNEDNTDITDVIMKLKEEQHIETINW